MHIHEYGDLVIGNGFASYSITYEGTKWVVVNVSNDGDRIDVLRPDIFTELVREGKTEREIQSYGSYTVDADRFDFIRSVIGNKANVHVLERYDQ